MSSLTEVAQQTKTFVIVGVITLVSVLGGYYGWVYVSELFRERNYEPPQPTYGFGPLPPIEFPVDNASNFTYQLETVGDEIPDIEGFFVPVYLITNLKKSSGFFSLDRAKKQASDLGFILEPEPISGTRYRWTRTTPIQATLDMDSVNNSFTLDVAWETDPGFLSQTAIPTEEMAIDEAKRFLDGADFLFDDLKEGRTETTLLEYRGGEFSPAVSLSEAQFVQVDIYRKPIVLGEQTFEVVPANPNKGIAQVLISSARGNGKRIVAVDYKYVTIDYENSQTYPYITGDQAWQLLQAGNGFVAVEPSVGNVGVIRQVEFGYFDPLDDQQKYLQPIYIFKGDNDFVAYVSAVHPQAFQGNRTGAETQ